MSAPFFRTATNFAKLPNRLSHRQLIREYELKQVLRFFRCGDTVLEIGAGAGWQAHALSRHGLKVIAIDIPDSRYATHRIWPVLEYDGHVIPLANASIDAIFSSNVLEHIQDITGFQNEMLRVLKPGGIAVHILPSASWRLWTIIAFYINRFRQIPRPQQLKGWKKTNGAFSSFLRRAMFILPHGAHGSAIGELSLFRRKRWLRLFADSGWEQITSHPNGLFYSGYHLCGDALSLKMRQQLSVVLGSSCWIYVMHKPGCSI
ncbi:MAG TPA: methyltransferase domain-containing protein [Oligoflexia bacterium]|nr:methyltransferase domain-containing protein [Oligoflexia bacterium]